MTKTFTLKIFRYDPERDKEPHYDEFEVPWEDKQMVLHAIQYVQDTHDPTVAVRWNCRAGKCGSCSAEVNGKPCLTCKTEITKNTKELTVRPMQAFPVVKDLVPDISSMWKELKNMPPFSPNDSEKPWKIHNEDVQACCEFKTCIECFLCQDVCHVLRDHKKDYIGPRWLVKTASLDRHPMDSVDRTAYLEERNIWMCNVTKCCTNICPEGIKITDNAIIPLKEKIVSSHSIGRKLFNIGKNNRTISIKKRQNT